MKNQRGVTLMSLAIYIVLIFIVLAILATVTANFQSNIKNISNQGMEDIELNKFNMYFLQEVKKSGNTCTIDNDGSRITFTNGNIYEYSEEDKAIYLKNTEEASSSIKIASNIFMCSFGQTSENGKTIVNVTIKAEEGEVKNKQYVLNDEKIEVAYVDEDEYTFIKKEPTEPGDSDEEPGDEEPDEYQEVEYLESTGTQWIDTKIRANSDDSLYIECMPTNNGPSSQQMIYGGRSGSSSSNQVMGCFDVEDKWSYFSWGANYNISIRPNLETKYTIKIENKSLFINDISYQTYGSDFSGDSDIYLFNLNGDTQNRPFVGRIYYFKIHNKINLVPCVRKSDNKPGMYDLVNGVFYTNQGTGDFSAGPDVN